MSGLFKVGLLSAILGSAHSEGAVTFSKQIAPILYENCASCHRPGQSAPFSLLSYADARKHASDLVKVTASGYMPPWLPAKGYGHFVGARHLSETQIALIREWADSGAPEGNVAELPEVPRFMEGWQLGVPDLVVRMPDEYRLAAEGRDLYRNFVIPAPLRETRYVRAFEFHPRNRGVHHVRIKFDATHQSRRLDAQDQEPGFPGMKTPAAFPLGHMTTWVPGQTPLAVSDGLQWSFEKDSDLVLEVHLQRTGKEETIQPEIGFYFTNAAPSKSSVLVGLSSQQIKISPGETNYVIERELKLPVDCQALTILPHMHYLGKEIEAYALLPDGRKEWLLRIEDWDFNWQGEYRYRDPVNLPAGSTVKMRARYDNSAANVRNPHHPPRPVVYGPQSTDEMCEVWVQMLVKNQGEIAALQKMQRSANERETVAFHEGQLRENPRNAAAHTALGKVLGPMGHLEQAVQHFQAALDIAPDLVEAHYYLGLSLFTMQQLDAARNEFEITTRLDPNHVKGHDGLGLVALKMNRFADAEKHFLRALELNPDDPAARANLQKLK